MAEILVNIHNQGGFEQGDIIHAYNDKEISRSHLQSICSHLKQPMNSHQYLDRDSVAEDFQKLTREFTFERVGNQVKRTNNLTNQVDMIGPEPQLIDGKMQHIDVDEFLKRRRKHINSNGSTKLPIFGSLKNEVWYGGKYTFSNLDTIWQKVEEKTEKLKSNHTKMRLPEDMLKNFLVIKVDNFDDIEKQDLESPLMDTSDPDNPLIVNKRKNYVVLSRINILNMPDVLDRNKKVDIRDILIARLPIIEKKLTPNTP